MKRNKLQLYLIGLLWWGLLAGCTASPVEEDMPPDALLVEVCFARPDLGMPMMLTRAGEAPTPTPEPEPLPEGSTVRIAAYHRGNVSEITQPVNFSATAPDFEATYVVAADGSLARCLVDEAGKQIAGDAENLAVRSGVYDFYAVSPARELTNTGGTYKITNIPHKEDVMTSFVRGVTVSESSRQVALATFSRKCALVVFNVASSISNVLPFERLYATRLTVSRISVSGASLVAGEETTGISPTGGDDDPGAQVVFEEREFEPVGVAPGATDIGLNKTKGVLLPKNETPFDVEIDVQRDDQVATLRATIENIFFEEGKRYTFTLEVKNNASSLQMTVVDWTPYLFTDTNVGGPPGGGPYPDPDINLGIGTTLTVASWTEIPWSDTNVGGV